MTMALFFFFATLVTVDARKCKEQHNISLQPP